MLLHEKEKENFFLPGTDSFFTRYEGQQVQKHHRQMLSSSLKDQKARILQMIGFQPGLCKSLGSKPQYRTLQMRELICKIWSTIVLWARNPTQSKKTTTSIRPTPQHPQKLGASSHLYTTKYTDSNTNNLQKIKHQKKKNYDWEKEPTATSLRNWPQRGEKKKKDDEYRI